MINQTELEASILSMKQQQFGSRYIAKQLGISKSTVNNIYNRILATQFKSSVDGPKMLFIDIESSPNICATFGRFNQNISQDGIIQEGGLILTSAWKWLGDTEVSGFASKNDLVKQQDYDQCVVLWDLLNQADVVIAHAARRFDTKIINARFAINGFERLPSSYKVIDTLTIAKKYFKFNSNKLDSLGQVFGVGEKQKHEGIKLWLKTMHGEDEAIQQMLDYNKQDVVLLEAVYNKLKHFGIDSSFNAGLYYQDSELRCKHCGGTDLMELSTFAYTAAGKYKQYSCNACGSNLRDRYNLLDSGKRKALTTAPN